MKIDQKEYLRDVAFMMIIGMYIQADIVLNGLRNALIDFIVACIGVTILMILHKNKQKAKQRFRRLR